MLVGLGMVVFIPKSTIHLMINRLYSEPADHIFEYFTWLGDGVSITILCILLLAWNRREGMIVSIACIAASLIAQFLKQIVFPGTPRPLLYFDNLQRMDELHRVKWIEDAFLNSFPSGHTTAAFAFFCALCIIIYKHRVLHMLFFLLALGIGYSRIYLSQHFLTDVLMGSFIGTSTAIAIVFLGQRYTGNLEIN
jgi:membrane-associated phospholipid phosphatase